MNAKSPTGAGLDEVRVFLERYPDAKGIDVVMTDCHGIGRGKTIRRHELESLYLTGRAMPASLFGQDVAGDDVDGTDLVLHDGGGDKRCWPVAGTLGFLPHLNRGQVLLSMYEADGSPFQADPRQALVRQVEIARQSGFTAMGAFELEFYLVDRERDDRGRYQPARYALSGRRSLNRNTMAVDELDEMSPFFDMIYEAAEQLDLPLESVISEYAVGQYELTIRYRDLLRAADDLVVAKRLVRSAARRFGMEACFMAKPFGQEAGSGMHLHLSLNDENGNNLYADLPDGQISPLMLHSIGGIRQTIGETMLVLAPFMNSWRRFASAVYSPASDSWGIENRTVALRIPNGSANTRHFEHRVAGVDANPYLVAAATLGGALYGIDRRCDPGLAAEGNDYAQGRVAELPKSWIEAMDWLETSDFMKEVMGPSLHRAFIAIKRAEYRRLALEVSEAEWSLYGFTV
ncbi:glutamine synthetase family protein [Pseudomonas veronii]|uniref:glutamine synthetase family protein n=1 Tax=Pseudomonas veronii TaxID=76761 RepID=UPI0021C1FA76|nr:glutamine synthetase family protein [Pseudomonas veronii]MCT9827731.1 glutamine synthetase family protein [Pseudomonas veronii]